MSNRRFTIQDVKNSAAGKNPKNAQIGVISAQKTPQQEQLGTLLKKESKEKEWLQWNIGYWCNERGLELVQEHRFDEERRFRFDWFIPALFTGIEFDGLMSEKSRHTTLTGFSNDCTKTNLAQKKGLKVLRYTILTYKDVLRDLTEIHYNKTIPF